MGYLTNTPSEHSTFEPSFILSTTMATHEPTSSPSLDSTNIPSEHPSAVPVFSQPIKETQHNAIWIVFSIMFLILIACVCSFCCIVYCKLKNQKDDVLEDIAVAKPHRDVIELVDDQSSIRLESFDKKDTFSMETTTPGNIEAIAEQMDGMLVEHWIKSIGFGQYLDAFLLHGFDTLIKIKAIECELNLADIGINEEHQQKVYAEIEKLQLIVDEGDAITRVDTREGDIVTTNGDVHYQNGQKLTDWLSEMHLNQYLGVFVENGFEDHMDALTELRNDDLRDMGISIMAHRLAIIKSINQIKQ